MKGFSIKTEIEEFNTFEQFVADAGLGPDDLVLCGEHTYNDYILSLATGVQTLFREKYSKGESTDGDVDAILDALRDKKYDRIIAIGGGTVIDIAKVVAVAGPEDKALEKLYDLMYSVLKSEPLKKFGVKEDDLPVFAKDVAQTQLRLLKNNYIKLSEEQILDIYRTAF